MFWTSKKTRPLSTASASPPCHRTSVSASLQAIAGPRSPPTVNVHPPVALWTAFNLFLPEWQDHCLRPTSRPLPTPLAGCAPPMVIPDLSSPALHTGFIRAIPELDDNVATTKFQEVSILVDSGSQQAPLCSTVVAERLGTTGKLRPFALQAGGQPLPIYDVGWCDLGINGRSCRTYFKSAALSPFDIILGESWLKEHRGVLDYTDNRLWQKDLGGNLRLLTFDKPGIDTPPSEVN